MGNQGGPARTGRVKTVGITPDPALMEWLSDRMGPTGRWSGPTHFFNWAIAQAQAEEELLEEALASGRADALLDLMRRDRGLGGKKRV